jgi:hypothetical protein
VHSGGVRYDCADERQIDRQRRGASALLGALSSELDQPLSIEREQLHTAELSLERRHHSSL